MSTKQQQAAAQQAQQEQIAAQPQASHQQTMAHQLIQPAFDEQPEQYIYYQQIEDSIDLFHVWVEWRPFSCVGGMECSAKIIMRCVTETLFATPLGGRENS